MGTSIDQWDILSVQLCTLIILFYEIFIFTYFILRSFMYLMYFNFIYYIIIGSVINTFQYIL